MDSAQELVAGLTGQVVSQIRLDFSLSLLTDEHWSVVIGGPGTVDGVAFTSGGYGEVARAIASLHRQRVRGAVLETDHSLTLTFDGGPDLVAGIDPTYDSWHVIAPDVGRVHVEGGGRLTEFDARPSTAG